ncbi:ATP-binding protein [Nocardioides mangrovi]|uniref:AAA family ATPase n=1 Tax=Nocardioides mangrovi TaxID=2874580 RepID=A0ABS7UJP8_9ACTN|nr:BTAD domain-containing putative transcriptional regulator [Nocardioides mangrovi]MBZ5741112.1 AAA family ATPase [Nocardioides mangrovi]
MTRLRVLDEVSWDGRPVPGERTHALLRILADAGSRGLSESALVEEIWGDDVPANPTKALQVVVSRARSATSAEVIERTPRGYRLALGPLDVDTWALRPEGLRLAAAGEYAAALPLLERADPDDEVVVALLRATAGVHGVPAALERYESYREDLADRLGVDPSPALQALHTELLARDRPVREGLLYEASRLIGRAGDVAALESMIRSSRVTSIVGPGGLGKTRLAHLMGRLAEQPVVHFVELAGVTSPEGVAVEVGDVLGVRESVAAGRLNAAVTRRADLMSRIVDQIGTAPALLILDNCEHLVDAVADLVSVLVQRTPELRVLTTTRAPLGIASERVYQLPQLSDDDAVELFRERATAARPGVRLDEAEVRSLVARLDGLPLAVELAAAKVRVMSVAEIERRLENRFALLRGGSRDAPERHQTLLAVIGWSWNLLDDVQRRALRRLSVFRDGFSLDAAEAVVGDDALAAVADLVDQSLVTVVEAAEGIRYRLLETVREFGHVALVDAGDDAETVERLRDWGADYALRCSRQLFGPLQIETMTAIRTEEGNLVDLLRRCLRDRAGEGTVALMACLSDFWTIEGSHLKVVNIAPDVEEVVLAAEIGDDLEDALRTTLSAIAFNSMIFTDSVAGRAFDRLEALGSGDPGSRGSVSARVLLAARKDIAEERLDVLEELCTDPDRRVARLAMQWSAQFYENQGDVELSLRRGLEALAITDDGDGPWGTALIRAQLAGLAMQVGDTQEAMGYARDAIPVLDALGASEDVAQLKAVLAMGAIEIGDLDEAERIFDEIEADDAGAGIFGAALILLCGRPELDLIAGRVDLGLQRFREAVTTLGARGFPELETMLGFEPWTLYAEAAAIAAHVHHGRQEEVEGMRRDLLTKAPEILTGMVGFLDFPVFGSILFALAEWELADDPDPERAVRAVRLLVYADRFGYNRQLPSLAWDRGLAMAESVLPGEVARFRATLDGRKAPELRQEVGALLAELG